MKISSTMTALALAMMTVAGCSTMDKSEPAAEMEKEAAPVAEMEKEAAPAAEGTVVETVPVETTGETTYVETGEIVTGETAVEGETMMVKEEEMKAEMAEETMTTETMAADDAAINACISAGGQIVSWVGDSSGAEQACRREDGLEYRLADAQYYQ